MAIKEIGGVYQNFEYYPARKSKQEGRWTILFPNGFKSTVKADSVEKVKLFIDTIINKGNEQNRTVQKV